MSSGMIDILDLPKTVKHGNNPEIPGCFHRNGFANMVPKSCGTRKILLAIILLGTYDALKSRASNAIAWIASDLAW